MIRLTQWRLAVAKRTEAEEIAALCKKIDRELGLSSSSYSLQVLQRSLDARKKPQLTYVYSLLLQGLSPRTEAALLQRKDPRLSFYTPVTYALPPRREFASADRPRPVVIGAGPAGLFAAYLLAAAGERPVIFERGKPVEERAKDVEAFWKTGKLLPDSNVLFGEGGAGAFSDGKLTTQIKDPAGRIPFVLETLIAHGAEESIRYEQKPHVGTDKLRDILKNLRRTIEAQGGSFCFSSHVTDFIWEANAEGKPLLQAIEINAKERIAASEVILAIGHSARDTVRLLYEKGLPMAAKDFAVGLRVSHPQAMLDLAQYGMERAACEALGLGAAAYRLSTTAGDHRPVFSFCMCPGGYIVNASSAQDGLCVNGMSYADRGGMRGNSGIVVGVTPADYPGEDALSGIRFQEELEHKAYRLGQGGIPVESYAAFAAGEGASDGAWFLGEQGSFAEAEKRLGIKGRFTPAPLHTLLPLPLYRAFVEAMTHFDRQIPGFAGADCFVAGVESRTSSPVRISRGEDGVSSIDGLYPCGEGAGYAGGIVSAAVDGLKVAEALLRNRDRS